MSASTYVGRIGALAATFGVGAAIFTGPAIAWADPAPADAAGSSAPDSASQAPAGTGSSTSVSRGRGARTGARMPQSAPKTSDPSSNAGALDAGVPDLAAAIQRNLAPRRSSDSAESAPQQPADLSPSPAAATTAKANNDAPAVASVAADTAANTAVDSPSPAAALATPAPAAAQTVTSLIETVTTAVAPAPSVIPSAVSPAITFPTAVATVANHISTVINTVVARLVNTFSGNSPFAPQADSPVNWLMFAAARRQPLAAATGAAQAVTETMPTLVLNGFNVVATSTKVVDTFTGRFEYFPGLPNMLQGRQDFELVNPTTGEKAGSFSALVTAGDPTSVGASYVQMFVTANDGKNVGTEAGQTPAVGSFISDFTLGFIGLSYSSIPSPTGDKVTVKLKTPLGAFPLPLTFDASKGIVDRSFDSRPMDLTGGYYIAPADPAAGKITATIGALPLFNSVQGEQVYGVFDSTGKQVGSFHGVSTVTSDTIGIYTKEILVTANDGINVGPAVGQTPTVGTVYNVGYFWSDNTWLLYSSVPHETGDVVSIKLKTGARVTDVTDLFDSFNASKEPAMKSLTAPGGQKFVATSDRIPFVVNGLPPAHMQTMGYQQFDVVDFLGRKIGSVDADVYAQWDGAGIHSKSILITNITEGTAGTTPLNVPSVGTVMNFIEFGNSGFGVVDSVIPQNGTNVNSFMFVSPFGNTPLLPSISVASHPVVTYTNPFVI